MGIKISANCNRHRALSALIQYNLQMSTKFCCCFFLVRCGFKFCSHCNRKRQREKSEKRLIFQFHFYTERKYTNHISNFILLFDCLQYSLQFIMPKKYIFSKTDHNYMMSIGCVVIREYICENATTKLKLKETDKLVFTFCRD